MKNSALKRTGRWLSNLTVGGAWGRTIDDRRQHNMRWFWFDGLFTSASDNIILNFISLYILSLGASEAQIGLMSSFSSVAAAIFLLPGALLAEGALRKRLVPLLCGVGARFAVLMLVFVPILFKGPALVWVAIALSVLRDSFNNLGFPAWMSVANEIVPIEGRGRYFGSRNFVMGIAGIVTTLAAGKLITLFVAPLGFQIALGAAFVLGISATFSYSHIQDQPTFQSSLQNTRLSFRSLAAMLKGQPQFVALTLTAAIWNFAINISGPFFNVQMVQTLKFSIASVGFLAVVSSVTGLATQNQIGALADRIGSRRLQLASMILIPSMPIAWLFVTKVWQVVLVNAFGGIIWGAFNLVSFNLLLASIPQDQVPRYSAVYQVVVMLSLALGALAGSAVITHWGFSAVLLGSLLFRIIATALFAKIVRDPSKTP
jgi:MFS family permease